MSGSSAFMTGILRRMTETTTSSAGGAPDTPAPLRRRNHLPVYLFLLALAGAAGEVGGQARPAWVAGLALGAFVACFVAFVEIAPHGRSLGVQRPLSPLARRLRACLVVAMAVLAFGTTRAYGGQWLVLFIFVVVAVVTVVPLRYAIVAIAAVAVAAATAGLGAHNDAATVAAAGSWALSTVMAGYIALLIRRSNVLICELRASQGEVARLAAADAVTDERLRFARDLHDLLGHSLSVIVLKAELARRRLERGEHDQARDDVNDLEQVARRSLEEVREAVTGYRVRSLSAELDGAREVLEAAGVEVTVSIAGDEPLPSGVDQLLAWVLREATTNIVRHSRARHVRVAVARDGAAARLEVDDDGVGQAHTGPESAVPGRGPGEGLTSPRVSTRSGEAQGGSGLSGLAERLAQAGGRLEAGPRAGGGFRVMALVPPAADQTTAPAP